MNKFSTNFKRLVNYIDLKSREEIRIFYNEILYKRSFNDKIMYLATLNALLFSHYSEDGTRRWNNIFIENFAKIKSGVFSPSIFENYIVEEEEIDINSNNDYIDKALAYIEDNIDEDLSLESLACEVHLSKNYFSNLFREVMGIRFSKYVNHRRVEYSKKLLAYTDLPLDIISQKCGYNSQSHFSTTFLHFEKMSPGAYRSSRLQKIS